MRLIDADRVIQSIDRQMIIARELLSNKPQSQEFVNIAEQSLKQEISNAPTVKAISVEWIEKYKRAKGWEVTVTTQNAIDNMLNAWEKENEM